MTRFRVLLLTVLVLACVGRMHATAEPIDPRLIMNGGHQSPCTPTLVGNDFDFSADGMGGGSLCFINDTTQNWTFLEIKTPTPEPTYVITCGGTSFTNCVILPQSGDFTIVDFSGGPGILAGNEFFVDLGTSGWPPNGVFQAFANPVPEPSTLALSLISLAPLLVRRLSRFGVKNS
jgi:hypothetical protein